LNRKTVQTSQERYAERRRSERVEKRGYCSLTSSDHSWSAYLVNLSEGGALIAIPEPHSLQLNETITLNLELESGGATILQGKVAHLKEHYVGLECEPRSEEDRKRLMRFLNSQKSR